MNQHQTAFDVVAMATVVKHLLNDAPPDKRDAVLTAAHSMIARDLASDVVMSAGHTPQIMELKARAIYRFTRNITNNTSPEDAADLLFGHHSGIGGSGHLDEYLEQPARLALARPNSFPAQQK
jgi:Tfp pilus assembly PilM family ATPase